MNQRPDDIESEADDDLILVDGPEDIPEFANEDEEAEFWATHSLSERFWATAPRTPEELLPPIREPSVRRDS